MILSKTIKINAVDNVLKSILLTLTKSRRLSSREVGGVLPYKIVSDNVLIQSFCFLSSAKRVA